MRRHTTTLRWRLMLSFSALILICLAISSVVGNRLYASAISEQNRVYTLQLLEQTQRNVDTYVRSAETQLSLLSDDQAIQAFFRMDEQTDEATRLALEGPARRVLTSYVQKLGHVYGLLLTGENGRYISNEFYRVTKDPLNEEPWYLAATDPQNPQTLLSRPIKRNLRNWRGYSVDDVVMLTCPVTDAATGKLLGAVSADLRLDELESSFSALRLDQTGIIFVLDQDGEVVYAPPDPLVYRVQPQWFQGEQTGVVTRVRDTNMTFLFSTSPYTGWKTIGMFQSDVPPRLVVAMQRVMVYVGLLTLAFAFITALILTQTITSPIAYLRKLMHEAEQGDLDVHYANRDSFDVDKLGASFNAMLGRIRDLLSQVVEEQKRKRKAEIDALQAQINPHFLYNTLDTIHWMAKDYQATDIEQMVSALTKLFRLSLSGGNEFITLGQEISHVQNYLYIQKVRYEDQLNYTFEVDESLLHLFVLKLIIQPLAENALYHGIKPKAGGHITLRIYRQADAVCIDVCDDGVGMPPERLRQINDNLTAGEREDGFGIYNVNERLALYFGVPYGVRLQANEHGGITSRLHHPLLEKPPQ